MKTPKISVVLPVYKAEPYLRRCLDSLACQTYENLEVLLVDDGSPDNCGAICEEYAARDRRFMVFHTPNRGAFMARTTALDHAAGDYIGFVDADDWLDPRMYEALLALAAAYDADIAQCEMINEGSYQQNRNIAMGEDRLYTKAELTEAMFRGEISHGLLNKLFRREIWENRRFEAGYYHLDAVTMAEAASFCERFVRTDAALYHYNTTNPSITRGTKGPAHIRSMERLFDAYAAAAGEAEAAGSYFICSEIPSAGRLILPAEEIPVGEAAAHIRRMHQIFCRYWDTAKKAEEYRQAPRAKKILWKIYHCCPVTASILVYLYARLK